MQLLRQCAEEDVTGDTRGRFLTAGNLEGHGAVDAHHIGTGNGIEQNTSFACDSYSVGLGGAWNINEKMRLNVSYFCSLYSDYDKQASYGAETYSRTNHVIGVGLDYKF